MTDKSVEITIAETNHEIQRYASIDVEFDHFKEAKHTKEIVSVFVISGYIRQHLSTNTNLDHSFIYNSIAYYYNLIASDNAENILRSFIVYKNDKIQQMTRKRDFTFRLLCILPIALLSIISSIIALSNPNMCSDGKYTVRPPLFLIIGDIFIIFQIGSYVYIQYCIYSKLDHGDIIVVFTTLFFCVTLPFLLIWCIIGFIEYDFEISLVCKQSIIGETFISWCITTALSMIIILSCIHYQIHSMASPRESTPESRERYRINSMSIVYFIVLSVMFFILTSTMNDKKCNNVQYSFINPDPATFLYIMNCGVLLAMLFYSIYLPLELDPDDDYCRVIGFIVKYCPSMRALIAVVCVICCIFGFVTYDQEMSHNCKKSNIGQIFIAWCIIMFISIVFSSAINIASNTSSCVTEKLCIILAVIIVFINPLIGIMMSIIGNDGGCNDLRMHLGISGGIAICWTIVGIILWKSAQKEITPNMVLKGKALVCGGGLCGMLIGWGLGFGKLNNTECVNSSVAAMIKYMCTWYLIVSGVMCIGICVYCYQWDEPDPDPFENRVRKFFAEVKEEFATENAEQREENARV